jgi:translation initiation factor 3 subunit F
MAKRKTLISSFSSVNLDCTHRHTNIMALGGSSTSSSALYLNFPPSAGAGVLNSRSLTGVQVHPVALFSILDHYLRRSDPEPEEEELNEDGTPKEKANGSENASTTRVIGTLLGTRTESEVEIKSCFAVPHHETSEQVQVDMDYHKTMFELHQRVNPEEVIVGWYATGPNINMYTSLIQDFFSRETAPHQAVHLTVDTEVRNDMGVKAYVSSPVGLSVKPENAVFIPLPVTLLSAPSERPSLSLLARTNGGLQSTTGGAMMLNDMDALSASFETVQGQLKRVLQYVRDVIEGKRKGDPVVGRYVIDAVSTVPIGSGFDAASGASELETLFNSHLQVSSESSTGMHALVLFTKSPLLLRAGRPYGLLIGQCCPKSSRIGWSAYSINMNYFHGPCIITTTTSKENYRIQRLFYFHYNSRLDIFTGFRTAFEYPS